MQGLGKLEKTKVLDLSAGFVQEVLTVWMLAMVNCCLMQEGFIAYMQIILAGDMSLYPFII